MLSCCSPPQESDEESYLSGPPSVTEIKESLAAFLDIHGGLEAKQAATEYACEDQAGLDLLGREVAVLVSDSDDDQSVSDVSGVNDGWGDEGDLVSDDSDSI